MKTIIVHPDTQQEVVILSPQVPFWGISVRVNERGEFIIECDERAPVLVNPKETQDE